MSVVGQAMAQVGRLSAAAILVASIGAISSSRLADAAELIPLGDLPGGQTMSESAGISADGSTVVGYSRGAKLNPEAFRWTKATGMVSLGWLSNVMPQSQAFGVSADGSTVVGQSHVADGGAQAFIWSEATGIAAIPDLAASRPNSIAYAVSSDGNTVVGSALDQRVAFRWTQATGMVNLGYLPGGGSHSVAYGVSGDGGTVVGVSRSAIGDEAFRWTAGDGMVGLGRLLPPSYSNSSYASSVSSDGKVITGFAFSGAAWEAFIWTAEGGMVGLGDLVGNRPSVYHSLAYSVSADGRVVVGFGDRPTRRLAFVWDKDNGMRSLESVLADLGVDLTGWELERASGVSADGTAISGHGTFNGIPTAFFANLGELAGLKLTQSVVAGCRNVTGRVRLTTPAPAAGRVVTLSDTLSAAVVPVKLVFPAGAIEKSFTIKTTAVIDPESGRIVASLDGSTVSQALTVRPMGVSAVSLKPATVVGSNEVTGTISLECKAGPGAVDVNLASSNPAVAFPVAASIAVPQGLQSATFKVTTNAVQSKSYATVSGTANGITKSKKLTLGVAASVSSTSLKFGSIAVGSTSSSLTLMLYNKGAIPFSVNGISLTGTYASWFAQTNDCPSSLPAGASCAISVSLKPLTATSRSAKLAISTSATTVPLNVSLSGTGIL